MINKSQQVMAVSHWYTSVVFQGFVLIILTLFLLVVAIIPPLVQLIFSRRRLAYELRAAAPLIQAPMEVGEDLKIIYDGTLLGRPYFAELRLVNLSRRDIPSSTFDQEMPLRFDLGIKLIKLLRVTHIPNSLPVPKINATDSTIEIGPSLIRRRSEILFTFLADGADISLTCHNPLIDVKINPLGPEDSRPRRGANAKTIVGWAAIAFIVWWVIEQPANAAHLVHSIGTFFSTAANGLAHFVSSI